MRRRQERSPEEALEDARWFAATRAVIETGARPAIDARATKLFGFLFRGGCDAQVSNEGFVVRFTWNPGPHLYFSALAPTVLGHLLGWAVAAERCHELRAVPLAPHGLKLIGGPRAGTEDKRLFWLENGEQVIRFALRLDSEALRGAAWPPEIALPSTEPVYLDLDPARPCPHCAVALGRVRDLGDVMICASCGRSFRSWDPKLPNPPRGASPWEDLP